MPVLRENEYRLLHALAAAPGPVEVQELSRLLELDQSLVQVAAAALGRLATVTEVPWDEYRLDDMGRQPLPERALLEALIQNEGKAGIKDLPGLSGLPQPVVGQTLKVLDQKGWASRAGGDLQVTDAGRAARGTIGADEALLTFLAGRDSASDAEIRAAGLDLDAANALLKGRKGLLKVKARTRRLVEATATGRGEAPQAVLRKEVNQLTGAMLADGSWREVDFRPYDMGADTEPAFPGKSHPFRRILDETRRVFLEMGFAEIASPFVESSFWDFDALFQPQDHPARDMQDTFYVSRPATCDLPDEELVDRVRRTHEDGGDTGSLGWGYRWSEELSHKPVLRTHTTATTIRALAAHTGGPGKYFCVGRVFRRETVDYKHLPVFYQVDGIIVDEKASLASLLGTLQAFYRKMGFSKVHFRPSFFPYTEPSVEVFVYMEQKQEWVEMGGAGIFRPEVTEPLGVSLPVLAWGLGLERLAMFRYGLSDIRQLYISDIQWLKEAELCR